MKHERVVRIVPISVLVASITLAILYRDRFDAGAPWIHDAGVLAPIMLMVLVRK
jgi:hypothetical protein